MISVLGAEKLSLVEIEAFLAASESVRFAGCGRTEIYGWVERLLCHHQYPLHGAAVQGAFAAPTGRSLWSRSCGKRQLLPVSGHGLIAFAGERLRTREQKQRFSGPWTRRTPDSLDDSSRGAAVSRDFGRSCMVLRSQEPLRASGTIALDETSMTPACQGHEALRRFGRRRVLHHGRGRALVSGQAATLAAAPLGLGRICLFRRSERPGRVVDLGAENGRMEQESEERRKESQRASGPGLGRFRFVCVREIERSTVSLRRPASACSSRSVRCLVAPGHRRGDSYAFRDAGR